VWHPIFISTLSGSATLVAYLTAFNVIHATLGLALGVGAALLILERTRLVDRVRAFDRERLVTNTR
jgi:hypothetical protein